MYCSHCGKEISDSATFCQFCGVKVTPIKADEIKATTTTAEQNNIIVDKLSDKWIWLISIVTPVVIIILDKYVLSGNLSFLSWVIPLVLNIIFLLKDKNELLRFNIDAEKWFLWGFVLIPLYLIVREAKTNRNFIPCVIWFFLMAVNIFIL